MEADSTLSNDIIQAIHKSASPVKLVIAMAGNGMQAISELMRYGNGSATLLAQHLLYDNAAFASYIGGKPDKYVSAQASRQLAMAAYIESRKISRAAYPTAGIGCTSSLVKPDGEREGRDHLIFVSAQDALHTRTTSIKLDSSLKRPRVEEEWINALAILQTIAACRDAADAMQNQLADSLAATDVVSTESNALADQALSELIHGQRASYLVGSETIAAPLVVCAGSFNPLHPGHIQLLKMGEKITGLPGVFELSITNVDKPPLDFVEIDKRLQQFQNRGTPLVLTNRPRYVNKIEIFAAGSVFVMGSDTFARVVDGRYYDPAESPLFIFESRGTKIIVAARRLGDGTILTGQAVLQNTQNPTRWAEITTCISEDDFLMDISSTNIRTGLSTTSLV